MGTVAIIYRVMPDDATINIKDLQDKIEAVIPKEAKLQGMMVKDVAFGIKAILMRILVNDKVGGGIPDKIEADVGAIAGVASIEAIEQSLTQD
jgi:translation elongation factor aEF-1 beta